jgi:hypothetical protein
MTTTLLLLLLLLLILLLICIYVKISVIELFTICCLQNYFFLFFESNCELNSIYFIFPAFILPAGFDYCTCAIDATHLGLVYIIYFFNNCHSSSIMDHGLEFDHPPSPPKLQGRSWVKQTSCAIFDCYVDK